ncbi:HAD family hydrolase [Pseudomonas poae]|uniref:HAD family hydrolase n=1 Tax=Pseudomonas poae TaxID=200451 RepID=UPI0030E36654
MKKILITDVDNTLFDWQRLWYESFSAMSTVAIEISGVEPEKFFTECSELHQKYGTSEYSFVLTELPSFKLLYGENVREAMHPAIEAFRNAQAINLKLYDGVASALDELRDRGVIIAAFTESKAFYTSERFRKLGLDGKIDYLYSPKIMIYLWIKNPNTWNFLILSTGLLRKESTSLIHTYWQVLLKNLVSRWTRQRT